MNKHVSLPVPPVAAGPVAAPVAADKLRACRNRVAALLNTAALLTTTVGLAAAVVLGSPKEPPGAGD
jgi:hypothetical protein